MIKERFKFFTYLLHKITLFIYKQMRKLLGFKWYLGSVRFMEFSIGSLTLLKTNSFTFCKIHSHSHLKLQTVKNVCEAPN
jgi:hypothetical protein